MGSAWRPTRPTAVVTWALIVGLLVDLLADGPPGLRAGLTALAVAVGLAVSTTPRPASLAFLAAGVGLASFVVVRASPLLAAMDLVASSAAFALAGAFAREGDPRRTSLRSYLTRSLSWFVAVPPALAFLGRPLGRLAFGRRTDWVVPRAIALSLAAGLMFVVLLGSADAVFADLLRAPLSEVPLARAPRHLAVVAGVGIAFVALALRSTRAVSVDEPWRPIEGGWTSCSSCSSASSSTRSSVAAGTSCSNAG